MEKFDLIVIGAGSGLDVAVGAAEHGLKVALVEEGPLGGTCLNRGCIPSKMIIYSAEIADLIRNSSAFGVKSRIEKIELEKITARASRKVDIESRNIQEALQSGKNPKLFQGRGKFVDHKVLEVNNQEITADKIVLATGSRPIIPQIEGLSKIDYLTSKEALRLKKIPKSMIIVGGGYIGVELGHFYASLGCKITLIQRSSLLIPREDKDVAESITRIWKKRYDIYTDADITKAWKKPGKDGLVFAELKIGKNKKIKKIISAEKILIATGVKPNSDSLYLNKTGVKMNEKCFVTVNRFMETNVKNIWALGDLAGVYFFKHSANLEAKCILNNILNKNKNKKIAIDYYPMPHAIFTAPQIAGFGLTEQEARESKKDFAIGRYYYRNTGMGEAMQEKEGFVKFIVDKKNKEILGCHILGPEASILIHEVVVAVKADRKKALDILRNSVHVHPALSEVLQRAALGVNF